MRDLKKEIAAFINQREVLILGFGKEGRSTYQTLRRCMPDIKICIADQNESIASEEDLQKDLNLSFELGAKYMDALSNYELVFKSPGISFKNYSVPKHQQVTSQTDLFIELFYSQIIGVTGTKGKSTTVSLIYHLLNSNGRKAMLVGNIGLPALEVLQDIDEETLIVYELSSHQLEYVNHSPHIAVFLNLFEEHLDHYNSYLSYQQAKANIAKYQSSTDYLIYNQDDENVKQRIKESGSEAQKLCFSANNDSACSMIENDSVILFNKEQFHLDLNRIPLLGKHNLLNILAALNVCTALGADINKSIESIYSFQSLPHRLESVGVFQGIHFVNDSIATIPEACIKAADTFENLDTLILGGFNRGIDYSLLIDYLVERKLPNLILLGEVGQIIRKQMEAKNYPQNLFDAVNMDEVVQIAFKQSREGRVCLLSPAASSYDSFHNFEDRGDQFKEKVRAHLKETEI